MSFQSICCVDECERAVGKHGARGWCRTHYERWRRHGTTSRVTTGDPGCSIDGCQNRHVSRGWCQAHYARWRRHGSPLGGGAPVMRGAVLEHRFWAKVDVRGPDECWLWLAGVGGGGYGRISDGEGGHVAAHRVSYEIANGEIPDGLHILHSCDNPPCVNPAHLRVGTAKDNVADAISRGRMVIPGNRGERNPAAKLSADSVHSMRVEYDASSVTAVELADRYGVSLATVNDVVHRRTWAHVS